MRSDAAPLWTSAELRAATGGTLAAETGVTGVSIDTRTIQPGDLFIALAGDNSDGHAHLDTAFARGAAIAMAHRDGDDPRLLLVADTMRGLQDLGRAGRARFGGTAIGVTGSVGKTTTKDMLKLALASYGPAHASVASYNNHWGVPLTLARLPRDAAFCIAEIGMNHPGEIAPLAALAAPHHAVISSIGTSHLGHMGSIHAIALEKSALIAALPPGGVAFVPDDAPGQDCFEAAAAQSGASLRRVGAGRSADFRLIDLTCSAEGSRFTLAGHEVTLEAPGRHLARNAAAALAVILSLGLDPAPAIASLRGYRPGAGRGLTEPLPSGAALMDESYNASSLSMRAAFDTLALLPATRRIAVLGDMLELGPFAEAEHAGLAPDAARAADLVFCCGPAMNALFTALPPEKRGAWAPDAASLAPLLKPFLTNGDLVLIKGSNGSRMRDIVAALKTPEPETREGAH
ncbi:UDP-N-acetylmuramoyl-tripeptide--D-alanyl-D-alanine ligase [Acidomonas methanolica]|uniref:UDP-N-acetylmuramoyl-tripeptide--D-alanyl-D- alanine ligase n=1 Tax=Acidomonas methanolica TaxID=437 RepID=UPI002119D86B|nr:UDP-N-acetylmuramoyl-tripeptide--D-alanyl-D-alanine ligase [Acidomonas methanolica]